MKKTINEKERQMEDMRCQNEKAVNSLKKDLEDVKRNMATLQASYEGLQHVSYPILCHLQTYQTLSSSLFLFCISDISSTKRASKWRPILESLGIRFIKVAKKKVMTWRDTYTLVSPIPLFLSPKILSTSFVIPTPFVIKVIMRLTTPQKIKYILLSRGWKHRTSA